MLLISVRGCSGHIEQIFRYKVSEIMIVEDPDGYSYGLLKIRYSDGSNEVIEDFVKLEVF